MRHLQLATVLIAVALTSACVSMPSGQDYTAFRNADPHSILVLPPLNKSTEVVAPYSVMAQLVAPIAESGFYVFPVAVVDQTFKNNGLTVANDIHAVPIQKLHEIFAADAALYITIEQYGTNYVVISSDTVVSVSASLVDLRTGDVLWQGAASASSAETRGNNGGGLVGMLVEAALNQIIETVTDRGFDIAAITSNRLFSAESYNGLLHGRRSKKYGQPATSEKQK
jgi:hypothetical protein